MFLIIGCGYVGERVADLLHDAAHPVIAVTHSAESAARLAVAKPYQVHTADVGDASSLSDLAHRLGVEPSVIVHCASSNRGGAGMYRRVYLEGCQNLLNTFPGAGLVFTSSTSVYPQIDGSWVTEESEATPERETSRLLRETEELVLAQDGLVARLAGIYGPGRSSVLKNFLAGTATIEGNDGEGRYLNQIHREDAAGALVHLMLTSAAGIYNVVDDQPMTQRECFVQLSSRFSKPMPPASPPNTDRKRAWTHKRIANARLHASGYVLRYPSYPDALQHDGDLVPSILAQLANPVQD